MFELTRMFVFAIGLSVVLMTLISAVQTVVLPRAAQSWLTGWVFGSSRWLFSMIAHERRSFEERDRVMALFAPLTLISLSVFWVLAVGFGYTLMFWGLQYGSWHDSFFVSGSSLLTLGTAPLPKTTFRFVAFTEATLGLGLVALLITFLPSLYGAFSRREAMVTLMEIRGGRPPAAVEFLVRFHLIGWLGGLDTQWVQWERWFADVQESHTSFPALNYFRSPQPDLSWITAAGAVLDAAALAESAVAGVGSAEARILIRSGYVALRRVADVFGLSYNADPAPDDPIALTRQEFDEALDAMAAAGIELIDDRDRAWADFAGWRVNYESTLLDLGDLLMAPYASWTADRSSVDLHEPRSTRWGLRRSGS